MVVQVVGVPDERLGEELCAWVRCAADARPSVGDLVEFCRARVKKKKNLSPFLSPFLAIAVAKKRFPFRVGWLVHSNEFGVKIEIIRTTFSICKDFFFNHGIAVTRWQSNNKISMSMVINFVMKKIRNEKDSIHFLISSFVYLLPVDQLDPLLLDKIKTDAVFFCVPDNQLFMKR